MISATHHLHYQAPAKAWIEALPLGNGSSGAMWYGGIAEDRISLNNTSFWSGTPLDDASHPVTAEIARSALATAKRAVQEEQYTHARRAIQQLQHSYPQSYQPLAQITRFVSGAITDESAYRRNLDLKTATATVAFAQPQGNISQRVYASLKDDALVIEVTGQGKARFVVDTQLKVAHTESDNTYGELHVTAPTDVAPTWLLREDPVSYDDQPSITGCIGISVIAGHATITHLDDHLLIECDLSSETALVLALSTATTFNTNDRSALVDVTHVSAGIKRTLAEAKRRGPGSLYQRHVASYQEQFNRSQLTMGSPRNEVAPTDARINAIQRSSGAEIGADPTLLALLFNYGRYLLISSSQPGGQPANLQGIWNESLQPPWSSNYTLNINLEMNYWLAETTGLTESLEPLFAYIEGLAKSGSEAAQRIYDAPGWVAHHCSDIWCYVDPVGDGTHDPSWAFWPFAGVWLVHHYFDHLDYGAGAEFFNRVWPTVRGAAEFVLAWLEPQSNGTLGTSLSTSPENHFLDSSGNASSLGVSSTMDLSLAQSLLKNVTRLAQQYPVDASLLHQIEHALKLFPPLPVTENGLIAEWQNKAELADPQHRHMAHLLNIFPLHAYGNTAPDGTDPEYAVTIQALSDSLDTRGDDSTGWSLAWKIAMRARLKQAHKVDDLLRLYFRTASTSTPHNLITGQWRGGLYPNLFSAHPPFQIDGNFGIVAGMTECLMQSTTDSITLLPALPAAMNEGTVTGLRTRSKLAADITWAAGELVEFTLTNPTAEILSTIISYRGISYGITLAGRQATTLTHQELIDKRALLR